jgi:hypothetical protein
MRWAGVIRWQADFATYALAKDAVSADSPLLSSCSAPWRAQRSGRGRLHWRRSVEMRFMSLCSGAMKMQRWLARCWRSACFAASAATFFAMLFEPSLRTSGDARARLERYATRPDIKDVLSVTFRALVPLPLDDMHVASFLVLPFIYLPFGNTLARERLTLCTARSFLALPFCTLLAVYPGECFIRHSILNDTLSS